MRFFFVIASLIIVCSVVSQHIPPKILSEQEVNYPSKDTAEIEDVFNVGVFPDEPTVDIEKWKAYLNDSLVLDDASMDTIPLGRYTVLVQFIVGENGKLNNISVLKEPGYGLGERVKRAISKCNGIWKPVVGDRGQVSINYRRQSITFVIEESCEELPVDVTL